MRFLLLACVAASMSSPLQAASSVEWNQHAMSLITVFEGSDYDKVTLDTDCQGLSLGKKQHTVSGNSFYEVLNEVVNKVGQAQFDRIVDQTLGDKAAEFQELVTYSKAGKDGLKKRLKLVRSWQEVNVNGRWVDLEEGPCSSGASRNIKAALLRLKKPFDDRLPAFLRHPAVVEAQNTLINRKGEMALQRATCWARPARNAQKPSFPEYLFFFDYLVQNGDSFTSSGHLQAVAKTIDLNADGTARQKMIQLKEWLEADFKNMGGGKPGHAVYAKSNATAWMKRFEDGKVTNDQIRLVYVGLVRAILGNNEWAYTAMNRRGTIGFGEGTVNNKPYSAAVMDELLSRAGDINASELSDIRCPS